MRTIRLLAAGAVALAMATAAPAAKVVYTYKGTFSGMRGFTPFTVDATFTGVGDTDDAITTGIFRLTPLTAFTAEADGPYTITTPFFFGVDSTHGWAGFYGGGINAFAFSSPALIGYDGASDLDLTTLPFYALANFDTDRGNITLMGQATGTLSIAVGAVPETATWAMMVGGFGLIGGAIRRTRSRGAAARHA